MGKHAEDVHLPLVSPYLATADKHQHSQRSLMQQLLPSASNEQLSTLCSDHIIVNETATAPLRLSQLPECTAVPCPLCPQCPQSAPAKLTQPPLDHLWFQHAYVVGYRPETWQHYLQQFEHDSWAEYREMVIRDKLPVVDGTKLDRAQLVADGLLIAENHEVQYADGSRPIHKGALACGYGHYHAWQACYNETHKIKDHTNTVKHCFIGEDDGDWTSHNLTMHDMRQWGDWLQESGLMLMYDVLYLGYGTTSWYWEPIASSPYFGKPAWTESRLFWYATHAYVVSAGAAQKLSTSYMPLAFPVDVFLAKLCSEGVLRCIQVVPGELITQSVNIRSSDTLGIN